jgi:hypothetical protein
MLQGNAAFDYFCPECTPPKCMNSSAAGSPNGKYHCIMEDTGTLCAANTTADESRFEYQLEDQKIRDSAIKHLHTAAVQIKDSASSYDNFFIGCGFHKPHVPWVFPAEFLANFPSDLADIPLASDPYAPQGMPPYAWHFPADVQGMDIKANGTGRVFDRRYTLEDAIEFHAFALVEALACVRPMAFLSGVRHLLPLPL